MAVNGDISTPEKRFVTETAAEIRSEMNMSRQQPITLKRVSILNKYFYINSSRVELK